MRRRSAETALCWFTLSMVAVYAPIETWTSLRDGLLSPYYIVDVVAMALLTLGAVRSLRARPRPAPALLSAALGWTAANAWRSTSDRVVHIHAGGELAYGTTELWSVAGATLIALVCFATSLYLVVKADASPPVSDE